MIISSHTKLIGTTIVKLRCDFTISKNCKIEWSTDYRVCLKTRSKRNNKDCCNKCASKISNSGSNNPAFKYIKNENFFENIDCEEKAYLLGWIASDGSIRNRTLHIELQNKDIEILNLFIKYISPQSSIAFRKNRDCSYLTISSQKLIKDICDALSVKPGNKQNKLRLPAFNNLLLKHFVRGFLDGDGWISIKTNGKYRSIMCGIATICPLLQKDLLNYSNSLNIICYSNKRGVEWYGKNSILFLQKLYSDSKIFLNRKHKIYESININEKT